MMRRWVCGVVVAAVVFGFLGWSELAMAKQPSEYFGEELWYAELGAIAGGGNQCAVDASFLFGLL